MSVASSLVLSLFFPLLGVVSDLELLLSELSSPLSELPGWLSRNEVRLRIIYNEPLAPILFQSPEFDSPKIGRHRSSPSYNP